MGGFFKRKFREAKSELKEELRHRREVRSEEKLSRRSERLAQAERVGKAKAKFEADQQLKRFKKPSQTFKGFAGPTQARPNAALGVADYLTGSGSGKPKKKKGVGLDMGKLF